MTVVAVDAPDGFTALLDPLPAGVRWKRPVRPPADLVVAFFTARADLERRWATLTVAAGATGTVWVAWPKKASGVPTDLTEQVFRDVILPTGWVDTKVCAIDATWSGLKFVLRRELRERAG
jgi:hypothetical protein